jgi:hypothetical protein
MGCEKEAFYSLVPTKHSKVIIDLHSNQSNYAIIFFFFVIYIYIYIYKFMN